MAIILFGGSFDPVHNGHLAMARAALLQVPKAELIWLPAACSPFKTGQKMAAQNHRLTMCRLAAAEDPRMKVSDLEFYMEKPSYTVRTVEYMQRIHPEKYYFLCGGDAFLSLQQWKEALTLCRMVTFLVANRVGRAPTALQQQAEWVTEIGGTVIFLPMKQVPVSSSEVRERLLKGEPSAGLLPVPVERYIQENGLYKE